MSLASFHRLGQSKEMYSISKASIKVMFAFWTSVYPTVQGWLM